MRWGRWVLIGLLLMMFSSSSAQFAIFQVGGTGVPSVTWIAFTPTGTSCGTGNNTCLVYVDNTGGQGNDSTCAVQSPPITTTPTAGTQCATVAKGASLLRDGKPDFLLLKNGDTFVGDKVGTLSKSGISTSQPIVISTYGAGARAIVETPTQTTGSCIQAGTNKGDFLIVDGIEWYAYTRDPGNVNFSIADAQSQMECMTFQQTSFNYIVFQDNLFHFYQLALDIETNSGAEPGATCSTCFLTFNGNVIVDDYPSAFNPHSQGAFVSGPIFTATFNMLDGNGFNTTLVGPYTASMTCASPAVFTVTASPVPFKNGSFVSLIGTPCTGFNTNTYYCVINISGNTFNVTANSGTGNECPNGTTTLNGTGSSSGLQVKANDFGAQIFNRNIYTNASPTVASNNISSNSSAEGVQFRAGGGPFTNNLFFNNSECWSIGDGISGTVTGTSINNVCMNSVDIAQGGSTPAALSRGDGSHVQDGTTGIIYTNNLFAHVTSAASDYGINLDAATTGAAVQNNVVCWHTPLIQDQGSGNTTTPNTTSTVTACTGLGFLDPTRTVATYDSTILGGPGTNAHFVACARGNSKASWNAACTAPNVNAWIRPGYNMTPFLLKRDLDPLANDNTPMWLSEVA